MKVDLPEPFAPAGAAPARAPDFHLTDLL